MDGWMDEYRLQGKGRMASPHVRASFCRCADVRYDIRLDTIRYAFGGLLSLVSWDILTARTVFPESNVRLRVVCSRAQR